MGNASDDEDDATVFVVVFLGRRVGLKWRG